MYVFSFSLQVLSFFWNLASLDSTERQDAARDLVEELIQNQKEHQSQNSLPSNDDDNAAATTKPTTTAALRNCSPLMDYAIKRLCRGLGSGRGAARQGFALTLTNLLEQGDACPLSSTDILSLLRTILDAPSSIKGTELRDLLLGQVFGYAAVIRSGITLSTDDTAAVAQHIVGLSLKKSFLREATTEVLLLLLEDLSEGDLGEVVEKAPELKKWLIGEGSSSNTTDGEKKNTTNADSDSKNKNKKKGNNADNDDADKAGEEQLCPEGLLLAVSLWGQLPEDIISSSHYLPISSNNNKDSKPVKGFFTNKGKAPATTTEWNSAACASAFFSEKHLQKIANAMHATTSSSPRLHSLWPTLLSLLLPGFIIKNKSSSSSGGGGGKAPSSSSAAAIPNAPSPQTSTVGTFWKIFAEQGVFQSQSHEKKALGFTLFSLILPHLSPQHIPLVFTPTFLRTLSNNMSKTDSYLHQSAKKCFATIVSVLEQQQQQKEGGDPSGIEMKTAVSIALERHGGVHIQKLLLSKLQKASGGNKKGDNNNADGGVGGNQKDNTNKHNDRVENAAEYAKQLQQTFIQGGGANDNDNDNAEVDLEAIQAQRRWAVEQLSGLMKQISNIPDVQKEIAIFLAVNAFVEPQQQVNGDGASNKKKKGGSSSGVAKTVASSLTTNNAKQQGEGGEEESVDQSLRLLCAARLIAQVDTITRASATTAVAQKKTDTNLFSELTSFLATVCKQGMAFVAPYNACQVAARYNSLHSKILAKQSSTMQNNVKKVPQQHQHQEEARLAALLKLTSLLELYSLGDAESADDSMASDLEQIFSAAFTDDGSGMKKKKKQNQQQEEGEEGEEEPYWADSLVDIVLSLLARPAIHPLPSAPLRDAAEAVFRSFVESVTDTGMSDMLSIMSRPLTGAGIDNEEEDGEEDEEEEEEGEDDDGSIDDVDAEMEENGSGSASEGDDDDEGVVQGKKEANDTDGTSSSDDDDDDDEKMTDADMFRMDDKLASYFSTLKEGRGGGAKSQKQDLLNFKMRVASLLESLFKKCPDSGLLPLAAEPLLTALDAASRPASGNMTLAERLSGLLNNRLCKTRAEASGAAMKTNSSDEDDSIKETTEVLEGQLRRALHLASRSLDKRVATAATSTYVYLQRVASTAGDAAGTASGEAALDDFFEKKRSRLSRGFFENLYKRVPQLAAAAIPKLLGMGVEARSDYLRLEAIQLVESITKMSTSDSNNSRGQGQEQEQQQGIVFVSAALDNNCDAIVQVVTGLLEKPLSKAQQQATAVKSCTKVVEAVDGVVDDEKRRSKLLKCVEKALEVFDGNVKIEVQMRRLESILEGEVDEEEGKKKKVAAGGGGNAKGEKKRKQEAGASSGAVVQRGGGKKNKV